MKADPRLAAMVLVVALLQILIAVRAVTVGIVGDEALALAGVRPFHLSALTDTANTHWINTLLIWLTQALGGIQPWELRIPNVLSFVLYASAGIWLARRHKSTAAQLFVFVGLFSDPFLVEFFGLARGYGMSLAFLAVAYAFLLSRNDADPQQTAKRVGIVLLFLGLTFYAQFATVNVVVAAVLALALDVVARRPARVWGDRGLRRRLTLICGCFVVLLLPGMYLVAHLKSIGALYAGGNVGFVHDTLGTITETWAYVDRLASGAPTTATFQYQPLTSWAVASAWFVAALCLCSAIYVVTRARRVRGLGPLELTTLIAAVAVGLTVAEHFVSSSYYPVQRVALQFVVVLTVMLGYVIDDIVDRIRWTVACVSISVLAVVLAALSFVNFAENATFDETLTWLASASDKAVIQQVIAIRADLVDRGERLSIGAPFPRTDALSYYVTYLAGPWLTLYVERPTMQTLPMTPNLDIYDVPSWARRWVPPGARLWAVVPPDGTEVWVSDSVRLKHRPSTADRSLGAGDSARGRY